MSQSHTLVLHYPRALVLDLPEEAQLFTLGVVLRDDLGGGHADLHTVHHELAGLLQGLLLTLGVLKKVKGSKVYMPSKFTHEQANAHFRTTTHTNNLV